MYSTDRAWRAHQPFLPDHLRCEGDRTPREEYWSWRDHRVHLDRHTDAEAPFKLVALHGGGGNGRLMAPVGIGVHGVAETVAPDLPGYGHTRLADGPYRYEDWCEVVADLVDAEVARDGRPVVLFGASMGGMLAYDVAARSEHVVGVVATCLLEPRDPDVRRAVVRFPAMAGAIPLVLALADRVGRIRVPVRWLANVRAIANDPRLADACRRDPTGGGTRVPLAFLSSWLRSDRPVPPQRFGTPLLLVHPAADRWTPASLSLEFLQQVAGPTAYVELANCGHFPVEEPGISAMHDAILDFITRLPQPSVRHGQDRRRVGVQRGAHAAGLHALGVRVDLSHVLAPHDDGAVGPVEHRAAGRGEELLGRASPPTRTSQGRHRDGLLQLADGADELVVLAPLHRGRA